MRVIAGTARRIQLRTVDSADTRPTTDRIKETLFNIIQFEIPGARVLDLFAGSGSLGIEALSRGAYNAFFSDVLKDAVLCIKDNLKKARLADQSEVLHGDFRSVLRRLKDRGVCFDIVFLDPPYGKGMAEQALSMIYEFDLLNPGALLIVEASLEEDFSIMSGHFQCIREKCYKTNKHLFFRKPGE